MEFLSLDTVKNPNAIEEIVCKAMDSLLRHSLNKELTELTICLSMPTEQGFINNLFDMFLCQLIAKRIKHCTKITLDNESIIWLAYVAETPGTAVMYVYYLAYWCKKRCKNELTFHDLCTQVFPSGAFANEDLHIIWDKQKVKRGSSMGSDNLLDYASAAKSLNIE